VEYLEERTVPTVIWGSAGSRNVVDSGGPVLTHVDVDLVFWGAGWNNAQTLMNNVTNAVQTIMDSPFLSGLSQYRGIGNGQLLRTDLVTSSNPAAQSRHAAFDTFVKAALNSSALPVTPNMDSQILYMVIPQPGTIDPAEGAGGAHGTDVSNFGRYQFAWTENVANLDDITYFFSHELTESVTDPQVNYRFGFWVPSTGNELCDGTGSDGQAQLYCYRINGVLVQSSLSQQDHAYDVYDGNTQKLTLTANRAVTISGDQLSSLDDTITVDQVSGGYKIILNGEVFQFDSRDFFARVAEVSSIAINSGNGNDTVNMERTVSGLPVTLNLGSGDDTVNLSPTAQNLGNLVGGITVNGGSGNDSLNFYDQSYNPNETYTITSSTVARLGMATVTYHKLAGVAIDTSNGTDMITVQNTAAGTPITVTGGSGNNTLVGSTGDTTWTVTGNNAGTLSSAAIAGTVSFSSVQNLTGGTGNNAFIFSDGAGVSGNIHDSGKGSFDYSAYTADVTVNLQKTLSTGVGGTFTGIQTFTGGDGNNTLAGPNVATVWNITGTNSGTVVTGSTTAFTGFQNLTGGSASNTFVFSDGAGISGSLDGGGAGSLDYSAYSTSVIVDLQTASATGIGGSIADIQNVTGGTGGGPGVYNILVGNGGNILTGGIGRRNLLIAGATASTLNGGDDEDILIGGTTAYDMDVASLMAIMDYWSGSTDDYASRVGNLLAGNGVPALNASTVTSNGGGNLLIGNLGLNLYYGNSADTTDYDPSSSAVFVPV